jgi:ubiquinol-cytochrome c reductase cytochrome c subunit
MSVLLLFLTLFAQTPAPRGNAETGKVLYTKIGCYQCHGREGQGATATGPRLNQNPIAYARFLSYLRKPTGEMPPYTAKVVSDQQAADIFAFLQSLPKPPAVESIPLLRP